MLLAACVGIMSASKIMATSFDISAQQGGLRSIFRDLYLSSRAMYLSLVTGLIYTLAYLHIMRKNAKGLALFSLLLLEIALISPAIFNPDALFGVSIFIAMFNIILICSCRNFEIAFAILDSASEFFLATKRIGFVQLFYFILQTILIAVFTIT
jgi:hypothetical protein